MDIDALLAEWETEQRNSHEHEATDMRGGMGHDAPAAAAAAAVATTAGTAAAPAEQPGAAPQPWTSLFKHARELEKQIKNTRPAVATTAAVNAGTSSKADYAHEKQLFTLRRR